ncbi:sodium/hydrogen exchanger 9-like isoform X2 [Mugil cephalus]|uniref:sodium/hydrogen exchanger 9-like isoform X2 n=1 Tax=Mugil cephalus TaxID=48193 RepID=UPI001FB61210|nr:sodium/hydrogen exchanger 9-like isoform X2 [Mugil cephalus]
MSEHVDHWRGTAQLALAPVSLAIITALSVWKLKQFKYRLINETGGAMFFGMLLGLIVRFSFSESACPCHGLNGTHCILPGNATSHWLSCIFLVSSPDMETFGSGILLSLFLPPIIFRAAYSLNQKRFIKNLGSVLTYAFLGTLISWMCIGACMYGFTRLMAQWGPAADANFSLTHCLLFGAIMSATDPVSILGLLSDLRVDLDLHMLLFGESVLNDAVAVVLTHAITNYNTVEKSPVFNLAAFLFSVGSFVWVLVGSFVLGFVFTVVTAILTKFTRLHEYPLLETSVFFLLSWSSFLSAEACGLSGIVAVLFCGLSQARYTNLNLSSEGRTRIKQLFEFLSFLGEIFIFSYMGYILLVFRHHVFNIVFISGAFLSIFVSRALNIYPLSFLLNLGRTRKIPRAFQHFMMFAGLRGAIAFSLASRQQDKAEETMAPIHATIHTTTLLLVAVTIWVLGASADPVLRRLDIRSAHRASPHGMRPASQMRHVKCRLCLSQPARVQRGLRATPKQLAPVPGNLERKTRIVRTDLKQFFKTPPVGVPRSSTDETNISPCGGQKMKRGAGG